MWGTRDDAETGLGRSAACVTQESGGERSPQLPEAEEGQGHSNLMLTAVNVNP